ncbi:hypothetical protein ABII15_00015 [Streptomyces sp. HUAS MG91]|uniref:Uncharacterized protein n=1 Tax=Streptomyces tabacisoli TaxID=3156398 RepID=A0AAU8IJZ6_9ACTN
MEVVADGADDSEADFSLAVLEAGFGVIGCVGHAEIGAENIDADLSLFGPVVGEAGHRVDAGESYGGLVVAELFGGFGVALGELGGIGAVGGAFVEELLAVGVQSGEDSTDQSEDGDGGLDDVLGADRLLAGVLGSQEGFGAVVEAVGESADEYQGGGGDESHGPQVGRVPAFLSGAALEWVAHEDERDACTRAGSCVSPLCDAAVSGSPRGSSW